MDESLNSMLYWWPRIVKLDIPKPATVLVTIDDTVEDIFNCILSEGEDREACRSAREKVKGIVSILDESVRKYLGGYPVFMRSDYTSCKHYSVRNPLYRIGSPEDFERNIYILIAECHEYLPIRGFFGAPRPRALAVREWLNIVRWTNKLPGFYGNIEVRVFTKNGVVEAVYPYYHWSGLEEHFIARGEVSDPEALLKDYVEKYVGEIISGIRVIKANAEKIASTEGLREYDWSIDFALVEKNGKKSWYFIDMALAEASWRPERKTDEDKLIEESLSLA